MSDEFDEEENKSNFTKNFYSGLTLIWNWETDEIKCTDGTLFGWHLETLITPLNTQINFKVAHSMREAEIKIDMKNIHTSD